MSTPVSRVLLDATHVLGHHDTLAESEAEWDAHFYHRVMGYQQLLQARALFEYLGDVNDGMIVDAGCGSGVVGAELLRQWPRAQLLAMDISENMLQLAHAQIEPNYAGRARFVQADLQQFHMPNMARCIISNAVMHWVPDHDLMFRNLYDTLLPGGILASQFAYRGPFFEQLFACLQGLLRIAPFSKYLSDYDWAAQPVSPERERAAMMQAGFKDARVTPYACIFHFENVAVHRLFMRKVVLRDVMLRLPEGDMQEHFVDEVLAFTDREIGACQQYYESMRCVAAR